MSFDMLVHAYKAETHFTTQAGGLHKTSSPRLNFQFCCLSTPHHSLLGKVPSCEVNVISTPAILKYRLVPPLASRTRLVAQQHSCEHGFKIQLCKQSYREIGKTYSNETGAALIALDVAARAIFTGAAELVLSES